MDPNVISGLAAYGPGWIVVGAIIVLAWYRETKTIPNMLDTFEKRSDKDREAWTAQADKNRDHHFQINKEEREACERRHVQLVDLGEKRHSEVLSALQLGRHATKQLHTAVALMAKELQLEHDLQEAAEGHRAKGNQQPKVT